MDKPDRRLRIVTRTDAAVVQRHLEERAYALRQAVLDAHDDASRDAAFCALFDYMEPDLRLIKGTQDEAAPGEQLGA